MQLGTASRVAASELFFQRPLPRRSLLTACVPLDSDHCKQALVSGSLLRSCKSAAVEIGHRIVTRVKSHTPILWESKRRLNTALKSADLVNNSLAFCSAMVDGNIVRMIGPVVGTAVSMILLYSDQGVEPPKGDTVMAKWKDAVTSPNKSSMYFGAAVDIPMASAGFLSQFCYGVFGNRPEQLGQLALGFLGFSSGLRALYKEARRAENQQKTGEASIPDSKTMSPMWRGIDIVDRAVLNRHTGFFIGLGVTSFQMLEAWNLSYQNYQNGMLMLLSTGVAMTLLWGNKAWQEMQWDKSHGREFFWVRGMRQVHHMVVQGRTHLHDIKNVIQELTGRVGPAEVPALIPVAMTPRSLATTRHGHAGVRHIHPAIGLPLAPHYVAMRPYAHVRHHAGDFRHRFPVRHGSITF